MGCFKVLLCIVLQTWVFVECDEHENKVDQPLVDASISELLEGFVDPHSFHYDRTTKYMRKDYAKEENKREVESAADSRCQYELQQCKNVIASDKSDEIFTKRFINLLLSNADLKEDGNIMKGSVFFHATSEQMEILRKFGDGKISVRQVDSILSDVIVPPQFDIFKEAMSISEVLLITAHQHGRLASTILATFFALIIIRRTRWSTGKVITVILGMIFLMSFFMTWFQLYKEAEIKILADAYKYSKMPVQCQPDKMSFWETLNSKFFGTKDECEQYFKGLLVDPLLEVTPAHALSHLCTKFFLTPLYQAGHAIAAFVEGATAKLPFPLNWFVTCLLFLGIIMVILVMPFCLSGGSFSLGLGPLFKICLKGGNPREKQTDKKELRDPIQIILQVSHEGAVKQIEPRRSGDGDHQVEDEGKKAIKESKSESVTGEATSGEEVSMATENIRIQDIEIEQKERRRKKKEEKGSGDR